jgi:hypothetical protein
LTRILVQEFNFKNNNTVTDDVEIEKWDTR